MTDVSTWNAVDASNTATPPDGWPEGMQPSAVNDAARMMMGALRREHDLITAKIGSTPGAISTTTISATTINATTVTTTGAINAGGTFTGHQINCDNINVGSTVTAAAVNSSGAITAAGTLTGGQINGNNLNIGSTITAAAINSTGNASVAGTLTAGGVSTFTVTSTGGMTISCPGSMEFSAGGNFNFTPTSNFRLTQNQAYKPGGGVWADVSDARTKRDVEAYSSGLAELNALRPVRYRKNGRGGMLDTDAQYVGLVADDARQAMPELVGTVRERLDPGDAEPTELLTLDATPIIFCLINAVKELTARLETLEAGGTTNV